VDRKRKKLTKTLFEPGQQTSLPIVEQSKGQKIIFFRAPVEKPGEKAAALARQVAESVKLAFALPSAVSVSGARSRPGKGSREDGSRRHGRRRPARCSFRRAVSVTVAGLFQWVDKLLLLNGPNALFLLFEQDTQGFFAGGERKPTELAV
jgi:hypothetical protein